MLFSFLVCAILLFGFGEPFQILRVQWEDSFELHCFPHSHYVHVIKLLYFCLQLLWLLLNKLFFGIAQGLVWTFFDVHACVILSDFCYSFPYMLQILET